MSFFQNVVSCLIWARDHFSYRSAVSHPSQRAILIRHVSVTKCPLLSDLSPRSFSLLVSGFPNKTTWPPSAMLDDVIYLKITFWWPLTRWFQWRHRLSHDTQPALCTPFPFTNQMPGFEVTWSFSTNHNSRLQTRPDSPNESTVLLLYNNYFRLL